MIMPFTVSWTNTHTIKVDDCFSTKQFIGSLLSLKQNNYMEAGFDFSFTKDV